MIADYTGEIEIAIFQSISERQERQIVSESRQKLCVLTALTRGLLNRRSPNLYMMYWDYCRLIFLKADLRLANPLSNAEAKRKGHSWQCLRTSPNLTGCHSNVHGR